MHIKTLTHCFSVIAITALLGGCPGPKSSSGAHSIANPTSEDVAPAEADASGAPVFPDEPFRAEQPSAGDPRPFNLPGVTEFKLGDHIDVYLVERHDLPTVSLELNFDGGSVSDKRGKEGMASICMAMVSQGTAKLDKLAFEEAQADLASSVSSYAGTETQGVSMRTLSKNFDATFALFTDTILSPGHRKEDLGRMVKRSLESLKQAKGSPGSVAGRLFESTIAGPKHPYGRVTTETSLKKISINDCKRYHKDYIKPQRARLFVVGDMTQEEITEKFSPLLERWKGKPRKLASIPEPGGRKGRVFFVDIPGAAQSSIYVSHLGPGRKDEDYYANQMMAGILGGNFSSRINMNLRENKGYSYGARGNFSYNRHYGTFVGRSSVRSDSTRQSLEEILSEMTRLKNGEAPAAAEELAREQNGAILSLPARFATGAQVLGMYRTLVYYGLPMTYFNDYVENYKAVTLQAVNEAAQKLLHPEDTTILVVGDADVAQIEHSAEGKDVPRLAADGQTPVTLLDSLKELAASELGGKGELVILDVDGNVKR